MHNYKLKDKVSHPVDRGYFIVTGIREDEIEIEGDWSGGTHNVNLRSWVKPGEVKPYVYTATPVQTVYVLMADGDGTMKSVDEPIGVAVTTLEEAKKYVSEGGVGYSHSYQALRVFKSKDDAINWKYNKEK